MQLKQWPFILTIAVDSAYPGPFRKDVERVMERVLEEAGKVIRESLPSLENGVELSVQYLIEKGVFHKICEMRGWKISAFTPQGIILEGKLLPNSISLTTEELKQLGFD